MQTRASVRVLLEEKLLGVELGRWFGGVGRDAHPSESVLRTDMEERENLHQKVVL